MKDHNWREVADYWMRAHPEPEWAAEALGIDLKLFFDCILKAVNEGYISKVDAYFHFADTPGQNEITRAIDRCGSIDPKVLCGELCGGFDDDALYAACCKGIEFYCRIRNIAPDYYECIADIETLLHGLVRRALKEKYGSGWWRNISERIRAVCAKRAKEDPVRLDPLPEECGDRVVWPSEDERVFLYTNFIDLKRIIHQNWPLFSGILPERFAGNKEDIGESISKANSIRNIIAHPIKVESYFWERVCGDDGAPVGINVNFAAQEDYRFLTSFRSEIDGGNWQFGNLEPTDTD